MSTPTLIRSGRLAACLLTVVGGMALAQTPETPERGNFDEETGRDLLNYPPHCSADYLHMTLRVRIPDMATRVMLVRETLSFQAYSKFSRPVGTLMLNAGNVRIESISSPGRTTKFNHDPVAETLTITLDPPLPQGQRGEVEINYQVTDPPDGIMWTTRHDDAPNLAPQLHSQGQAESNRAWFICHDFPNSRLSTEIYASVPHGFTAISNGSLRSTTRDADGLDTFHFALDKAHPAYLVSLIVGTFDVVDVNSGGKVPMPVYVDPGRKADAAKTFERTPAMLRFLESFSGTAYPWPQYAQTTVRNFSAGGMENTGATTLVDTCVLDKIALADKDVDDLIVHEFAHQWFGDLITCKSWEHIWLNEGFATYVEGLWAAHRNTRDRSAATNFDDPDLAGVVWSWASEVFENDHVAAPTQPGMVSKQYRYADDVFDREANPYPKGAMVLHMLHRMLGDDLFLRTIHEHVKAHTGMCVETWQFRRVAEQVSGRSLQRFFDQWCVRPGVPTLKVTPVWQPTNTAQPSGPGTLTITVEQTQPINPENPAFLIDTSARVRLDSARREWTSIPVRGDERTLVVTKELPAPPRDFAFNPELRSLARTTVVTDIESLARIAKDGPTVLSKLQAVDQLGRSTSDESGRAVHELASIVRDQNSHRVLRLAALVALGKLAESGEHLSDIAIAEIVLKDRLDLQTASHAIRALGSAKSPLADKLSDHLAAMFDGESSYTLRAAIIETLGKRSLERHRAIIIRALDTPSNDHSIEKSAIKALSLAKTRENLAVILARTASSRHMSVRVAAATALAEFVDLDPDAVFSIEQRLVHEREFRVSGAAGDALAKLASAGPHAERARAILVEHAAQAKGRAARARAAGWLEDHVDE